MYRPPRPPWGGDRLPKGAGRLSAGYIIGGGAGCIIGKTGKSGNSGGNSSVSEPGPELEIDGKSCPPFKYTEKVNKL